MKAMTRLNRDDVIKAVGGVDDVTIAEIIGTGASAEELAEAQAWIANDDPLLNAGKPLPTGRVRELSDILGELETDEEEEKEAGPVVGEDRKSTRLNSSHLGISYAVFCLKKKITN